MSRFMLTLRLSLALLLPCIAHAATPVPATLPAGGFAAVDAAVQAEMSRQQIVGVAIGIIRDGQIVYLQGYGLADREKKTPVTTRTVMNWASNCKPMAAVMAMQLVDEKRLNLEADVRNYVPEFPDKGARITPRLILCHQSGIVHYSNGRVIPTPRTYSQPDPFTDPVLALDKFNQSPLLYPPGEKTSYSTYAYILMSAIVQRAGHQPYDEQIMTRLARPLGLKTFQLDVATKNAPDWAAGYVKFANRSIRAPEDANYWKHGGGGFKSDIEDFARWAQALLEGRLVSPEALKTMWTRQKLASGQVTDWGLGFSLRQTAAGLRVSHSGKQSEATSWLSIEPRQKSGIVVLCNCGFADPGALARVVIAASTQPAP